MTISGMMKALDTNFLITLRPSFTVSSNSDDIGNIYDLDNDTFWASSGSDDLTTETIEIDFTNSVDIGAIHLKDINWKEYTIEYWTGSAWSALTIVDSDIDSVYGEAIYGDSEYNNGTIDYSNNTLDARYFEVSQTTTKLKISITKTIIADEEKQAGEIYIGDLIGTFIDDITCSPNSYTPTPISSEPLILTKSNRGSIRVARGAKYNAKFRVRELWEADDRELVQNMYLAGEFVIYPCGGARAYEDIGFRITDFYHVIWDGDFSNPWSVGRNKDMGIDISFELRER